MLRASEYAQKIPCLLCVYILCAGSKHGKVTSISLDPPPVGACTFPKGENVTATINMEIGKF